MKSVERSLAYGALVLGALALVVRNPREAGKVSVDLTELARMIEREEDHVTVDELHAMLKEGRKLRILDLRDSIDFAEYHIPTAVRMEIPQLMSLGDPHTDMLVLYSEGGIHAAQAWLLLVAKGHRNVFTLRGGLTEWRKHATDLERKAATAPLRWGRGDDTTRTQKRPKVLPKEPERAREVC